MRIADASIQAVKDQTDILQIIGAYTTPKQTGGFWKASCFAGETEYLTYDGIQRFDKTVGTTQKVLSKYGAWTDAEIKSFGVAPLMKVTVERNKVTREIYATANHRWLVRPGRSHKVRHERLTSDLQPGDPLAYQLPAPKLRSRATPSVPGVQAGFVFGDGSFHGDGSMARFHGAKDANMLPWFGPANIGTDRGVTVIRGLPRFFKELPDLDAGKSYLLGWLAGYFAADGTVSKQGQVSLASARRDHLEFVRMVADRLGMPTYPITSRTRTTPLPAGGHAVDHVIYGVEFMATRLRSDFFLIPAHRSRWEAAQARRQRAERAGWTVVSVEDTDRVEEVFCAVVPEFEEFALADYLYVKNCTFHNERTASMSIDPTKGLFNCLAAETMVITSDGVQAIKNLAGSTVRVLTSDGSWVDAPFRAYGTQQLWRLDVSRHGQIKTLFATAGHRWLLHHDTLPHGAELTTATLSVGDELAYVSPDASPEESAVGWRLMNVTPTDRVEEVYCAEVPGTHSFVLEDNILTGNCFGCGESGDTLSFIMKMEGLQFAEAVERLAVLGGVELRYEGGKPGQRSKLGKTTELAEITAAAQETFHANLLNPSSDGAVAARDYLRDRGITDADVERFALGWAADEWDGVASKLIHHGDFSVDAAIAAGVLGKGRQGPIDRFRGRLMFPIHDSTGRRVIGFGGRVVPGVELSTWTHDDEPPKYINSPAGPLYDKSKALYGFHFARKAAMREGRIVVVEGYTDVIAFHRAGLEHATATCGTAMTREHLRVLGRTADHIVLALDSDTAGLEAAEKARNLALEVDAPPVSVMPLPRGMDPADLVAEGREAIDQAVASTVTATEFALRFRISRADLSTQDSRVAAMREVVPLLAAMDDRVLRYTYITDVVAPSVRVPAHVIEGEVDAARAPRQRAKMGVASTPSDVEPSLPAQVRLERLVLQAALQAPELLPERWTDISVAEFTADASQVLWTAIVEAERSGPTDPAQRMEAVLKRLPDDDWRSRVRALTLQESSVPVEEGKFRVLLTEFRVAAHRRKLDGLRASLAASTDPDEQRALLVQIEGLRKTVVTV